MTASCPVCVSPEEILALVTIQQLLQQLEPGLLGAKLHPLQERLTQLMDKHGLTSQDLAKPIRIVHAGKRRVIAKSFEAVAAVTLACKRLKIWHFSRENGKTTEREVSPQRLVHWGSPGSDAGRGLKLVLAGVVAD